MKRLLEQLDHILDESSAIQFAAHDLWPHDDLKNVEIRKKSISLGPPAGELSGERPASSGLLDGYSLTRPKVHQPPAPAARAAFRVLDAE